jgi:hypothetical protein
MFFLVGLSPFAQLCFVTASILAGVDELEEVRLRDATMSHHEIMVRFKKLFGREMTPKERQAFFLPHDSSRGPEEE